MNTAARRPIFADDLAADEFAQVVGELRAEMNFRLHAWVVMPDHIHLVLTTPAGQPIGRVIGRLKGRVAHRWNRKWGLRGSLWQGRFHERALRSPLAIIAAIDYVHRNPVVGGLVAEPEDFRWSSASGWRVRLSPLGDTSGEVLPEYWG